RSADGGATVVAVPVRPGIRPPGSRLARAAAPVLVACAGPAATSTYAVPAGAAAPRFAPGGFDAEAYGAADGYPAGNRSTFFRLPYLVGSHSHLDEIFEGRVVRGGPRP